MNYDKYYQHLWDLTQDEQLLIESGLIDEGAWEGETHLNELNTPLDKLLVNTGTHKNVSVLLYPGCFAPIHEGHLEAMNIAKRTVGAQTGEKVGAGYFAPDHDDYVQRKTVDMRFNNANRMSIAKLVTASSDWMEVDPWNSMHASQSLNFTTLYDRFDQYMKLQVPGVNVKTYLVFGQDNCLFANAFLNSGYAVCVLRPNSSPNLSRLLPDIEGRVLFSTEAPPAVSSSEVRKQSFQALPQVTEILQASF